MSIKPILHIPHASTNIPDKTGYLVSDDKLEDEMLLLTDWHTNELFTFAGGIPIIADFNRVFCDVERFADDEQEVMASYGMGVCYKRCDDGSDLRILTTEQQSTIINSFYKPHHDKLTVAVDEQLKVNGHALIIDCHSFSNEPFKRDLSQETPRPGICIGTDSYHTPMALLHFTEAYFKGRGYKVKCNSPYSGSIIPFKHYKKDKRVCSIMIEVNRDIYMVPGTNSKSRGYFKTKLAIHEYFVKVLRHFL
ncbi:N-formylglutamate amidohydrolase [Mucilaginibacter sp. HD30]